MIATTIGKIGFRTEQLYGEGYRDAASVMAHETFELSNTCILDTLSKTLFANTDYGRQLQHLSKVISGEEDDENLEMFLDEAFNNEEIGIGFFTNVLEEVKNKTGKEIRYALWLCDSIEDIKKEYEIDENANKLTEFDVYGISDIVLSDLKTQGKLYGYEDEPKPCGCILK